MRSFKNNRFSDYIFDRTSKTDKEYNDQKNYFSLTNKNYEDQTKDLFGAYYKNNTEYNQTVDEVFKGFFDSVKETSEFSDMQERTKNNAMLSYIASKKLSESLDKVVREKFQEIEEKRKQQQSAPDKVKQDDIKETIKKNQDAIRAAMRKAAKETSEEVEKAEELNVIMNGIGSEGSTPQKEDDISTMMKLYELVRNNPHFLKMVEMAGRSQRKAHSTMMTKSTGFGSPIGIEMGNDLSKMIPSEIALFSDPETEVLFLKNFLNESLFQWHQKAEEKLACGPIIVCIDESGSMYGNCNQFSKSFLFGIYVIAKKQKRPMYVIEFDCGIKTTKIESELDIIECMKTFLGGGTSFEAPLMESVRILRDEKEMRRADLFFITDGAGSISESLLNEIKKIKEEISFKILGLQIGGGYTDILKTFCDKVFSPKNLDSEAAIEFQEEAFSI